MHAEDSIGFWSRVRHVRNGEGLLSFAGRKLQSAGVGKAAVLPFKPISSDGDRQRCCAGELHRDRNLDFPAVSFLHRRRRQHDREGWWMFVIGDIDRVRSKRSNGSACRIRQVDLELRRAGVRLIVDPEGLVTERGGVVVSLVQ